MSGPMAPSVRRKLLRSEAVSWLVAALAASTIAIVVLLLLAGQLGP